MGAGAADGDEVSVVLEWGVAEDCPPDEQPIASIATAATRTRARAARGVGAMSSKATRGPCYVGSVDRFALPAAASIVVGLLLGAAAVFGVTLMIQQDTKPPLQAGDPGSSVLNRVEYGDRS
jgi:hypothetical protein